MTIFGEIMLKVQLTILSLVTFSVFASKDISDSSFSLAPSSLFWGNVDGIDYLTATRNLKNLEYCTGNWAFAATSVLSDRFKVLRKAAWPDYNISPQVALSCISSVQGCNQEGDPAAVYNYILQNGITDETCAVYQARDFSNGVPCDRYARCKTCYANGKCDIPSKYYVYNITGYTVIQGESQMISALQGGPIVCRLNNTEQFQGIGNGNEVFIPSPSKALGSIYVSIVGYGTDVRDNKFWAGRSNWGCAWGDIGFFNIIRGTDALGIEEYCLYPTPNLTITAVTTNSLGKEEKTFINDLGIPKEEESSSLRAESIEEKLNAALPTSWDWRNVYGKNYLSWIRNQNIPQYANYSWAFATASSVTDRLNIVIFNETSSHLVISPQDIINKVVLTNGPGDLTQVYKYFFNTGISDDTCLQYVGNNANSVDCRNCVPPAPSTDSNSLCAPISPYFQFKIRSFKNLAGATKMMQEIYTNGPITCGIYASVGFANYTGGIYSETSSVSTISQWVSIVGWGVDPTTKNQYWIGRNSLGTSWGNYGFFMMQMYRDNLGIETDCISALPAFL